MENPEEILHSLEEFSKTKPKDIPRELEEYLCFVAKTGDPVYQWSAIKSLFREKMINVITEFYESCPSVEIPPCPNVDIFNYDVMKNFILEKLDTFAAAPFTLQRICELLTMPRKEYNRIDKYMRALEKNILVVSTIEPGGRRTMENGDGIVNGLDSEHLPETSNSSNSSNDINVEEMDDTPAWPRLLQNETGSYQNETNSTSDVPSQEIIQETLVTASKTPDATCTSSQDSVITCRNSEEPYVSIEPVPSNTCAQQDNPDEADVSVTITAIPAGVQKRRNSVEPVVSSESSEEITESCDNSEKPADSSIETETKPEEEETSSSRQIEDADSSSSTEDEKDTESKEEKVPEENLPDDAVSENELSSTENEEAKFSNEENEVGTSEPDQTSEEKVDGEKSEIEGSEQIIVDTTKCSNISTPQEDKDDLEITSSDKIDEEVHSSQTEIKVEEEQQNEISTGENSEESQEVEQVEVEKVVEKEEENLPTPMEVDEECNNSENIDVVRAEATSDSPL